MKQFKYKFDDLFNPVLEALHHLGGSSTVSEMEDYVAKALELTEDEINDIHRGNVTKLTYRLAWARNYLKRYGLLENSQRGVWALTSEGQKTKSVDKKKVVKGVKELEKKNQKESKIEEYDDKEPIELTWKEELLETLQNTLPDKFERLCQRLLRELGFINVEVTGRTGDGGIDGKGVIKLGGVLSFHVVFQSKRLKGSVSASTVRDFRGAMIGRADKGLLITTGTFTNEAKKEAQRDEAPPIDLIDGLEFAEKLKDLGLGVETQVETQKVEKVKINKAWFDTL